MIRYPGVEQLLRIHERQVERFGGAAGVRDRGALEAALARPRATFSGEDLHPDPAAKAAVLLHSLIASHPFVDGNKRTAAMAAELFLLFNGFELVVGEPEMEEMVMAAARGELQVEAVGVWFRQRVVPIEVG